MCLRNLLVPMLCLLAGCSAPGRMPAGDASLDRDFIRRFGRPEDMPPPQRQALNEPADPLARRSPWIFFASRTEQAPAPKPPPPIPRPKVEPTPRAPARDVSWQPNTWEWNGKEFVWQSGRWTRVPPGLIWQHGLWTQNEFGEFLWRTGGWAPPGADPNPLVATR